MAKVLKTVAVVAGAVALVAGAVALTIGTGGAFLGVSAATWGTIATAASIAAGVASIGSQLLTKPPPARGSETKIQIGVEPPAPYLMGEAYSAGILRHDTGYGATLNNVPNPYRGMVIVYSVAGALTACTPQVDFAPVGSWYTGYLYTATQLGASPEASALTPNFTGMPGWGASSKLSGEAAILWNMKFDKDGKRFASGVPAIGAVWQGVKVYDPRLDSTYPGGSGAQRIADESTWAYSDNPALHAIAYAYGRYQNGKKVFGIGQPAEGIDLARFVSWANVCDANTWRLSGTIYEPGDRWANLKDIMSAGCGEPVVTGGTLSVRYRAPQVSLATVTEDDIADDDFSVTAMQSYRDRLNGIVPKYRSPDHNWEFVSAEKVSVSTYVTEDGEIKDEERQWNLVRDVEQVSQLAAYALQDARELGPITITLKPQWRSYKPGECLTLNLPSLDFNGDAIILQREIDPATMKVKLTLIGETNAKHAYALALTGTPPPTPALGQTAQERDELFADLSAIDLSTGFATGVLPVAKADPALKNASITINAAGTLSGAGAGSVTLTGMGYTGALDATAGATWGTNIGSRPTELTDGRITAGLTATGDVNRNLPAVIKSNITVDQVTDGATYKRFAATEQTKLGGVETGATLGANLATNVTNKSLANLDSAANTKLGGVATGATKNTITRSATAPTSPTDGDVWVDTTTVPNKIKTRIAGAWQESASLNIGALADLSAIDLSTGFATGVLPVAKADPALKNASITINAAGTLSGAGAGSVTIGGLGYTGELAADVTLTHTAAAITGQAATATSSDFSAVSGVTKPSNYAGKILDTRANDSEPSFYYGLGIGVLEEFKNSNFSASGSSGYNHLLSATPWPDASGGPIRQRLTDSIGQIFERYSTNSTTWGSWGRNYNAYYKPVFGADLREDSSTIATLAAFKTIQGTAAAITGQAATATSSDFSVVTGATKPEANADVTKSIKDGPSEITIEYASDGTAKSGQLPKAANYKLVTSGGVAQTTGVAWTVTTISGTISASISGSGTGALSIASLSTAEAVLTLSATKNSQVYYYTVKVKKNTAAASTGGGGSSSASVTSLSNITTTSFAAISTDLLVTLPAGVTTATLTASGVDLAIDGASPSGTSSVEYKWQRDNAGVWADVGAVATSSPHPQSVNEGGFYSADFGSITCNRSATGLTAGSAQKFRLVGRVSAGNIRTIYSYPYPNVSVTS